MTQSIRLLSTDSTHPDFIHLVALLDADLRVRDGEDHAFFAQYNKVDAIKEVMVAYADEQPVGCGAFKLYEGKVAELKRMYVLPEFRGQGIAPALLKALENWAGSLGYTAFVLETGLKMPEAIGLYTKSGSERIPNYGQYEGVTSSVCMKKLLQAQ
jgi:GNAT superfamily N-acetyltransferase